MSSSGDIAWVDLPPEQARAVAASELRGGLAWADTISKSEAIKRYATSRGGLFAPSSGEAAQKAVFPAIQANAWLLFNGGKAKVSPDTVGIPKP